MKSRIIKISALAALFLTLFVWSCDPADLPSIPPRANLDFVVADNSFQPLEKARIYLFPFKGNYDAYVLENPAGKESIVPNLNARNIGSTDSIGQYIFTNYELQGNEFASGNTWVHRPDPIYYRVEATLIDGGDTIYVTNDGTQNILSFDELDNGVVLTEEIDVLVQ
ncbi:MAG: hypothetical protein AAF927_14675 [Bacteroidota bacterium]